MKKIILIAFCIVFAFANVALSQSDVTFLWDANTESDLAGYKIHRGDSSRTYIETVDVGNVNEYTWEGLAEGTHYFAATAYDVDENESDYSNEVNHIVDLPPAAPKKFTIKVTITETGAVTVERTSE